MSYISHTKNHRKMSIEEQIKENGLRVYKDIIPKHVVCFNCGLERTLEVWLKEHGKRCQLPKLNTDRMT